MEAPEVVTTMVTSWFEFSPSDTPAMASTGGVVSMVKLLRTTVTFPAESRASIRTT